MKLAYLNIVLCNVLNSLLSLSQAVEICNGGFVMSTITSLGLGSGIDVAELVQNLIDAEQEPVEERLDTKEELYEAQISAYGSLKSSMYAFQTSVGKLDTISTFNAKQVSSSNEDLITATATSIAENGTYDIEVSQRAKGHSLSTGTFSSTTDAIGTGSLTFKFGTTDYDEDPVDSYNGFTQNADAATISIDISSGDNSLSGIRDKINDADMGVQASIIKVGADQYKLVMTSDTGEDMSMQITVDDDDSGDTDTSGLSQLAFNENATNLTQVQAGQNSEISINGLDVSSSSNQIVGAISGVTLDVVNSNPGENIRLEISQDASGVKELITDFVDKYNEMIYTISKYNEYDQETNSAGELFGESLLRSMESEIRSVISSSIEGIAIGGFSSLSNIGITSRVYDASTTSYDEDDENFVMPELSGMLVLDEYALDEIIEDNFDVIGAIFAPVGSPSDTNITYVSSSDQTKAGRYSVDITQLATQAELVGDGVLDFSSPLTIDDDNNSFTIKVDGVSSGAITLTNGDYSSGSALAAEIQSKINGDSNIKGNGSFIQVSYDDTVKNFTFISSLYGSSSKVEFTSVDTNTESQLGFAIGSGTNGLDVEGTIGGQLAVGDGQELTGFGSDTQGLVLTIGGATPGMRGSVSFSRGLADSMFDLLDQYVKSSGLIESKIDGIQSSVTKIDEERAALVLRMETLEARYLETFNAMDLLVSEYNSIGSYLSEQLDLLPGVTMFNKD